MHKLKLHQETLRKLTADPRRTFAGSDGPSCLISQCPIFNTWLILIVLWISMFQSQSIAVQKQKSTGIASHSINAAFTDADR